MNYHENALKLINDVKSNIRTKTRNLPISSVLKQCMNVSFTEPIPYQTQIHIFQIIIDEITDIHTKYEAFCRAHVPCMSLLAYDPHDMFELKNIYKLTKDRKKSFIGEIEYIHNIILDTTLILNSIKINDSILPSYIILWIIDHIIDQNIFTIYERINIIENIRKSIMGLIKK